jgi:hypothetical protein
MTALLRCVGREGDPLRLADDEHARYHLYDDVLRSARIGTERPILEIVQRDPDHAMREAAIVAHIDRVAGELAVEAAFSEWWQNQTDYLREDELPFAARRATEWRLIKQIREGRDFDPQGVTAGTDWLQTSLATETASEDALRVLAAVGRTKRVRATAIQRLAQSG